ncbi:MAG: DUF4350 domain-containing protein [Thermoplasmatota archaeon]
MIEQVRTAYMYLLIMGIGVVLFLFSVMVPVLSSNADFSIYNSSWNGCSELGKDVYSTGSFLPTVDVSGSTEDRIVHNSFSELKGELKPADSVILIIGPDLEFDSKEGSFMHDFLLRGGTLLLADDVGTGNGLLGYLNTSTRITGELMVDLSFMKSSEFSVTTELADHEVTRNVSQLLLNYPSTISASPRARSIVNSSKTSWLDLDEDKVLDGSEPEGPFPLLTIESYGKGELIVLSEPSLLINQMREKMDNGIFVSNLISYVSSGREVMVIDESHRDLTNPVQLANLFISDFNTEEKVGIMVGVTLLFLFFNTPLPRKLLRTVKTFLARVLSEGIGLEKETVDPVQVVMAKHPEWDRRILERLIREIDS